MLTVITKLIGALYRIPLTNIVGAEGIGLYQMVFPLYTVLLTLTSGGVTTAMAKYVATLDAKRSSEAAEKTVKVTMIFLLMTGAVAAAFLALFCRWIAKIQGNPDVILPYLGIAPALVFVAAVSCFRGYFQGKQNMFPTAFSQLIEQIVKLAAGLSLASIWIKRSIKLAVFGATLGVTVSEIVATVVLIIFYFTSKFFKNRRMKISLKDIRQIEAAVDAAKPEKLSALPKRNEILSNIYKTAIPSALGSLVLPITQLMDSVLIVNVLAGLGMSDNTATSLFGIINGPINSLINLPVVITLSISIALLPKIAALKSDKKSIDEPIMTALKISAALSVPCVAVFCAFPDKVLSLLYTGGLSEAQLVLAAKLLRISSITVLYVSLLQVATSALQAVGKAHLPAINLLIGAAVKIALTLVLLLKIGIIGAAIASVICYIATSSLDFLQLKRLKIKGSGIYSEMIAPIISSLIMVAFIWLGFVLFAFLPQKVGTVLALIMGAIAYVVFIFVLRGINKKDLKSLLGE